MEEAKNMVEHLFKDQGAKVSNEQKKFVYKLVRDAYAQKRDCTVSLLLADYKKLGEKEKKNKDGEMLIGSEQELRRILL